MDESLRRAVAEQIDIVSAVGLGRSTLAFLQSVPLVVVPAGAIRHETPGQYVRGDQVVKLTSRITSVGHKPVLLHELLHAYHNQKIAGGLGNPDIRNLYEHAKAMMIYGAKSHMMQNPAEFFACAGTTFLFGVTAQEPFRRERLLKQSELLQFLSEIFGPTCGSYEGWLSGQAPIQVKELSIQSTSCLANL